MRAPALLALTSLLQAPPSAAPAEPPVYETTVPVREEPLPAPAEGPSVDPKNYRLVLVGDVITGLGVGTFIMMTAGFVVASASSDKAAGLKSMGNDEDQAEIDRLDRRTETGQLIGYTGAGLTVALLASGITLIAVGRSRERKRREALQDQPQVRLMWPSPSVSRRGLGVGWTLRF